MPTPISLPQTGTPISTKGAVEPYIPLGQDVQQENALKYHFTLGTNSPGYDALLQSAQMGMDDEIKHQIMRQEQLKDGEIRHQLLEEVAAESKNRTIDPQAYEFIQGLSSQELQDPELRYIKAYANMVLDIPYKHRSFFKDFPEPEVQNEYLDKSRGAADHIAFSEHVYQRVAKLEAKKGNMSLLGKGYEYAEQWLVPFASYFNKRNTVEGPKVGSLLLGNNIREQFQSLQSLPLSQRVAAFDKAIDEIEDDNLMDALEFASSMLHLSYDEEAMADFFTGLEVATTLPLGTAGKAVKGLKKGAETGVAKPMLDNLKAPPKPGTAPRAPNVSRETSPVASQLRDQVEAARPGNPHIVADSLAAGGREKEAALHKGLKLQVIEKSEPPKTPKQREELDAYVPSVFDYKEATKTRRSVSKLTAAAARRIREALAGVDRELQEALDLSQGVVSRFTSQRMLEEGWKVAQKDFEKMYPQVSDAIIETRFGMPEQDKANAAFIEVYFGKPDKSFFDQPSHADYAARNHYNLLPNSYSIEPLGKGYGIAVKTYVDETKIKDFLLNTADPTPSSTANTLAGYFRTSDDLVNNLSREQRKRITHAYALLQNKAKTAAKAISDVGKVPGRMTRFEKVLKASMHHKVPRTVQWRNRLTGQIEKKHTEKVGLNFTRTQFEQKYFELNNMAPSETEVLAYATYQRLLDFDYVIRNLDLTRDKVRLGIQEWTFRGWRAVDESGRREQDNIPMFDGSLRDDLPYGDSEHSVVAIYDDTDGFADVKDVNSISTADKEFIKKLINEDGYRIVEIANPDMKPLRDVLNSDEAVNFVLVKSPQTRPLSLTQLPKQEGGHRIPKDPFYIKAARVLRPSRKQRDADGKITEHESDNWFYEGDITLYGIHSEAKAREIVPHLHRARDLFLAGSKEEFIEYVSKYVPRDAERFWKDFEDKIIPTNVDYYIVKTGQGVNDIPEFKKGLHTKFPNLVDTIDSKFNKYRLINKKFAGQKNPDLFSWDTVGYNESNPVVKLKSARYIDPLEAMQTSFSSLMRNRAYSDYITTSVESWIEEFGGLMKTPLTTLRANPLHYIHNPEWVDKPTNRAAYMAAVNSRRAILQLLGTKSELRNNLEWFKDKIVDQAYKMIGDSKSEKLSDAMGPTSNDPLSYVRSAAFHMKLGLLNPIQMWTQSQTLFHMTAITGNPVRAGRSFVGATYMQLLQNATNPKVIDHVASLASRSGYGSKEEFLESYQALQKSGLWYVEGEHGWRNDVLDPKIFQGSVGTLLDKGTLFFKGTERYVRLASWNIAYKEWKLANPKAALDNTALQKILARQDILSLNMTNASAAALQRGVFSLTTQFFGYQLRILDQILGKRLTRSEKARMIAMYSAVYGVPIGAGMGALTPWYGDIKMSAEEAGVKVDEGAWQLFFDGAMSFLTEGLTGEQYNPAKRYGPGGFEILKTVFDEGPSEDTLLAILGASASIFGDAVKWAMPAVTTIWSQTWDDDAEKIPLQTQDFIDAFRSISTVNNSVKAYMAYYYHNYYTRDGQKIIDANETDALMTAMFGLTKQPIERMYQMMEELREDKSAKDELKKGYNKAIRQGLRADNSKDQEYYWKKARIFLKSAQLTEREAAKWFQEAGRGNESLFLEMDRRYREAQEAKTRGQ